LTVERAQAEYDIAGQEVDHENTIVEISAQSRGRNSE
jgi:hypothetical protein